MHIRIVFFIFLSNLFLIFPDEGDVLNILSKMTVEEKAWQVMMINISNTKDVHSYIKKEFSKGFPGAILLFKQNLPSSPKEFFEYTSKMKNAFKMVANENKLHSSHPLIALDNEGGRVFRTSSLTTFLPPPRMIASKISPDQAEKLFNLIAKQMKMMGLDFNLAPIAECATNINEVFLGDRTFSYSEKETVDFSNAFVKGMNEAGILCSLKHFPGNGALDPHGDVATLSCTSEEFENEYVSSFKKIIDKKHKALSLLLSHVVFTVIDDRPFCLSNKGIKEIIRKKMGFSSLILTDDIAMGALKKHYSSSDNALLALEAGVDMIMCSERNVFPIIDAIIKKAKKDKDFAIRLDEAVKNVLSAKSAIFEIDKSSGTKEAFDEKLFNELKEKGDKIVKSMF